MPIYVFKCSSCGHEVEKLQNDSTPPKICVSCRETLTMQKTISAPNFVLKGGGYYQTDFKHK